MGNAEDTLVTVGSLRSNAICCAASNLKSCNVASINPAVLGKPSITLPGEIQVGFSNNIADDSNAYHYWSIDADVIITYNPISGTMHGHAMISNGSSYTIEYCGFNTHVWKEIDVEKLGDNEGVDYVATGGEQVYDRLMHKSLIRQANMDTTTMATYSVKFYYTPEFAASTADIPGFINQVIMETNQGYANSQVPLTVTAHCIELATINDISSASDMLSNFANMKSSSSELRGGADAAAILVDNFQACGVGYLNTISSGITFTATMKSCAVGYYSFGHELGHNIGLTHDPATSANSNYPYGHGHLIAQGTASTGYRTILAYSATGHSTRVNYYSNPDVSYPATGTPTGVKGLSNNAALLIQNRMSLAAVGDESTTCGSLTAASTSAPPSLPPGTCVTTAGDACVFPFVWQGRTFTTCTSSDADSPWCATSGGWGYCSPGCPGGNL